MNNHARSVAIYGALLVGLMGAGLSVIVGTILGLVSGFFGGWIDELVQYVYSTVASIPYLLLMLAPGQ